jgi:hypothetical protein
MHILDETSNNNDSVNEIPEADRLEIKAITHELDMILQELKNEGEMI